jgi:hypothetical protein
MLSLFAISYNTMRLGLEAQNAAAFRLLRLAGGTSKMAPDIPEQIASPADDAPTAITIAPKRRHAAKKIHKKSAPVRKRGKRAKRG